MPKIIKLFVQGLGGGFLLKNCFLLIPDYLWWSNCVYRVVVWRWQISSWLRWAISLHQELGKLTHPWPAPGCRRQRHRHRHHCRPSLRMPSHELSIITQIDRGGVAALIVVASLMMYNTHLPSILCFHSVLYGTKKQHFVHAKSGESCPHCLPYHIKIIFITFFIITIFLITL